MKNNLSRRDFLKGAAVGAVGVAATGLLSACGTSSSGEATATSTPTAAEPAVKVFEETINWDAEYDVVVVGFGAAGAVSAITAAEQGAKVLLLEKAPLGEEGGNSRYAYQLILCPTDHDKMLTYYKNLRGSFDSQTDDILEAIVSGQMTTYDWIKNHGAETITQFPYIEYPELEGSEAALSMVIGTTGADSAFWKLCRKNVYDNPNSIDVWYASPAKQLIQDKDTKIIHGVVLENGGQEYNIRAINGVVMALGGFENSDYYLENFAQMGDCHAKGAHYNTGDGIAMAIDVGAMLWHMSTLAGPDVNFIIPETGNAAGYAFTVAPSDTGNVWFTGFTNHNTIVVGGDGTRFMNECIYPRHGHVDVGGTYFSNQIPTNSWCVFDETARNTVPAYSTWSEGMVDELEKGWIVKADTIEELAEITGIDADGLTLEIQKYNSYCADGFDPEFEVSADCLKPIETAPFYGFPVKASLTNTQGGAKRNAECEILDVFGNTIPHLYGAGEYGSFYTDIYNGGGNLAECIYSGVKTGTLASSAKSDVIQSSLLASAPVDLSVVEAEISLGENEYLGTGNGIGGDVKVKCTIIDGEITAVEIVSQTETEGIGSVAVDEMPSMFVGLTSADEVNAVDSVSGATVTSNAIKEAVLDCMTQAGII